MKIKTFPSAIVFDWDNTLVDSWPAIMESINAAREKFGLKAWSLKEIKLNCTRAARESFPEWFGDQWKEAYKFYYEGFDKIRKSREINTLPGAEELLQWLKKHEIPAFVVSNKRGDYLRIESKRLKWDEHFVAIIGAQDAPCDKPARDHVDFALDQGGLVASEAIWFVGDSEADMLCAQNSECTPVLIGDDLTAKKLGVDLVFPDCYALQELLIGLQNKNLYLK